MATCLEHSFRKCAEEKPSCEVCCAASGECTKFYIEHLVGSANNLQIGDKIWLSSGCEGEVAPAGIYNDCGAEGNCTQAVSTRIYGCVTVGSGGLVTAIAACSGEVTCGSGAGATCNSASTIQTPVNVFWNGRNKTSVSALNTWEDLYTQPDFFKPTPGSSAMQVMELPGFFIKQIWIHNCYKGSTNDKRFSIRIYNATGGVRTLNGETGQVDTVSNPVEAMLADNMLVADGARVAILDEGSPLSLKSSKDKVQIQANTDTTGWTVTMWIEQENQQWDYIKTIGQSVYNSG